MKKLILGLGLLLSGAIAQAQNGLEGIVVEKYYVSNAADAAGSVGALPAGSVTYRIYADMLPGYNFQALYGTPGASGHTLLVNTSTTFFNNEDYGTTTPGNSPTNVRKNSVLLDSWFSVGGAAAGKVGVFKSEDTDGSPGNAQSILQNNDPSTTGALNIGTTASLLANDGMITGTPVSVTFVGIAAGDLAAFDGTSQAGNSFSTNNGSIAALGGATGPTAANRVLIGQFTSTGVLHFELNVQIGTPTGGVQQYVASNPVGAEITIPSLTGTFNAPNIAPTISITAPTTGSTFLVGQTVGITVNAADANGTVDSVQYFVDGNKVGSKVGAPYTNTFNWTATVGAHVLTAKATDNGGTTTTSAAVNITVGNIIPPTVSISSPANGATFFSGATVAINATAADADGTVDSVEFFVDGTKVGADLAGPYSFSWVATIGTHTLTAKATDNNGATTTSATVSINVFSSSTSYAVIGSANKCDGSVFCLPINALAAVSNVIGYDLTLTYNKTKVSPTGVVTVSNALINPAYTSTANSIDTATGTILISVYFNASAPANANFSGTGQLLCVEFAKTAGFAAVDTATFAITSIQESYFNGVQPKLASSGSYTTYQDSVFKSSLRFWFDNSPIKYNSAVPADYVITNIYGANNACTTTSATAVQPNLSGDFNYNVSNGTSINIKKDIAATTDVQPVVNGFDAFLTRRVLINDVTFIPSIYQVIAMDVNTDGVISAGDLSQINQRTVLFIPEFKQAWNYNAGGVSNGQLSKDWLFIDQTTLNSNPAYQISSTYPANNGVGYSKAKVPVVPFCYAVPSISSGACISLSTETYKGVLLGDVNGNYATYNVGPNPYKTGNSKVVFDLSKAVVANGYADVPVTVWADENVNALDFALQLNESNISYQSVRENTSYLTGLANYNTADKTLRYTASSLQNVELGKSVVSVRVAVKGTSIDAADFTSAVAYLNGEKVQVELSGNAADNMVNVYPNPAKDVVNVIASEDATVQLISLQGNSVVLQQNIVANQNQVLNTQALANGIYMMKVYNNNFVTTKKVVIQK